MKSLHLAAIAAITLYQPAFSQAPNTFESPVALKAADLLPASMLRGPSHRVRDLVMSDGFMAHFQIDTDFGSFEAIGVPQVHTRIRETEAIRTLVETSKGDLFAEGMKRSLTQPVEAVKNIVSDPVNAVKRAPKTVGHFFSKVGGSIERGVGKIKESIENDEPSSNANISGTLKSASGFDKAKLDTAKQLGVDPYSDNTRLQEEMDKVTWAFFAGGLPLRIGAVVASAGVAVAATKMVGIPEDTYALTQAELALRDQRSLSTMDINPQDIQTFQIQPNLSTTRRHRIVKSLEALPHAQGRGRIIQLANSCATPEQSDFLISALSMLEMRQRSGAADYKELQVIGRLPGGITQTGPLEVPAPVDEVIWTEQVATFAQRDDINAPAKVLIHTGHLSTMTTTGLTAAGWKMVPVPYQDR